MIGLPLRLETSQQMNVPSSNMGSSALKPCSTQQQALSASVRNVTLLEPPVLAPAGSPH